MTDELKKLLLSALSAIKHSDDKEAKNLLEKIGAFTASQNTQNTDPVLFKKLQKLLGHLRITAFPQIFDEEEAADILSRHYLDSFDIEIDMENWITARLFLIPFIPRDSLREKFRKALTENQQKIGNLTVGQWIQEFEKMFSVKTRNLSALVEFSAKHPQAILLNSIEKSRLKELLHTYDFLLVSTLPITGESLEKIINTPVNFVSNMPSAFPTATYPQKQLRDTTKAPQLITLPFHDALRKYPTFGEQLVTSGKIQLQGFPESVRPSVKNWIADYTSNFGYEKNNLLKRENYLFRSVNSQHLSQNDRERLSFVLKAFEENSPVSFNKDSGMLVFKEAEVVAQSEKTKEGTLSFAYHQKMPFEKKSAPETTFSAPAPIAPAAPLVQEPAPKNNSNPYLVKIPPKTAPIPKNVVNLKELV